VRTPRSAGDHPGDDAAVTIREARHDAAPADAYRLAFFAHVREDATYRGALVVVTTDGDPLDFVYTESVTLSRLSQRLLGPRVGGYMIERVLLPPLLEQAGAGVMLLCFDDPALLQRRVRLPVPCIVFAPGDAAHRAGAWVTETVRAGDAPPETCWLPPQHREPATRSLEVALADMAPFSVREPFAQLRAAIAELNGQ